MTSFTCAALKEKVWWKPASSSEGARRPTNPVALTTRPTTDTRFLRREAEQFAPRTAANSDAASLAPAR